MNADPLAQLLADMYNDVDQFEYGGGPTPATDCYEEAAWLRAHRDELLAALGGSMLGPSFTPGHTVWVFGEDA